MLVSELMLQQTQVPRVVPRYHRVPRSLPDPGGLRRRAAWARWCGPWAGLGYNRRAVNLHARRRAWWSSATAGALPDDLDRAAGAARRGPVHGPGRAGLRLRARRGRGRHQRGPGAGPAGRPLPRAGARCRPWPTRPCPRAGGGPGTRPCSTWGPPCARSRHRGCDGCPVAGGCAWWAAGRPEPDPARGSAGVSTGQSRFEGSDRQGRGRLVDALRGAGRVAPGRAGRAAGWPDDPAAPPGGRGAGPRRPGRRTPPARSAPLTARRRTGDARRFRVGRGRAGQVEVLDDQRG